MSEEQVYDYNLISQFEEEAKKEYIKVSDGSEVLIYTTKAPEDKRNGYTFLLIPGWGTIVPGWEQVLMEAIKDFDILYIESREKDSFKPSKEKSKNNIERLALDVKEIIEHLEIDQSKIITVTSSYSTMISANFLGTKKFETALNILIGPVEKLNMPALSRYWNFVLPIFFFYPLKPIWRWWLKKFKSEDTVQAAKYIRVLDEADPKKWAKVARAICFTKVWDLYKQIENTEVIVVGMEKDKMHAATVAKQITDSIEGARYIDFGTNRATHSAQMVEFIREELEKLS